MIESIGEATVRTTPAAVVAFVTDLERYKEADWKIGRVLETRSDDARFFMRHDGALRGIPGPAVSLEMKVEGLSVSYRSVPSFPSRWILTFDGGFELEETAEGTRVVHTERFRFFAPWRFVAEPFLRSWLATDIAAEMVRMKEILEAEARALDAT